MFTKGIIRKIVGMIDSNHITKTTHKQCFQLPINSTGKVSDS